MEELSETQKAFLLIVNTLDAGVKRGNFTREEVLNYDESLRVLEKFIVENTPVKDKVEEIKK